MWRFLSTERFPPVADATAEGLVRFGGQLSVEWLVDAYRRGIFPWPLCHGDRHVLAWFSPDPRAILELDSLHVSRRLARRLRQGEFRPTRDRAFGEVIAACALPRRHEPGTWISPELAAAYRQLHACGIAHSVEVWHDEALVGGVYGVALGGYFSAESMFCFRRDAEKAALYFLVEHLKQQGFTLLDVQVITDHTAKLGATEIPRSEFLRRLQQALAQEVSFKAGD